MNAQSNAPTASTDPRQPADASAPANRQAPSPPPPTRGEATFPWVRFIIVQVVLAVLFWFAAVWLSVAFWGTGANYTAIGLWAIFFVLIFASLITHALLELRLTRGG